MDFFSFHIISLVKLSLIGRQVTAAAFESPSDGVNSVASINAVEKNSGRGVVLSELVRASEVLPFLHLYLEYAAAFSMRTPFHKGFPSIPGD